MTKITPLLAILGAEERLCQKLYNIDKKLEDRVNEERAILEKPFECDAKHRDLDVVRQDINDLDRQRDTVEKQLRECREELRKYLRMLDGDATCQV